MFLFDNSYYWCSALDTLHLVLCTKTIYWYLITNYNNPDNLDNTTWSMALQTDCNVSSPGSFPAPREIIMASQGIIGLIVECFFARRVWLSGSCHSPVLLVPISWYRSQWARIGRLWSLSCVYFRCLFVPSFSSHLQVVLATLHFGLGVVFTAESFILGHFSKFESLTWVTCTGLGAAAVSDIMIALSMCYYLQKKRTGVDRYVILKKS